MVTSTTPFFANDSPLCRGSSPPPAAKPPPWIQTMTGAFFALRGTQTFSVRQSSLTFAKLISSKTFGCMHAAGVWLASRTPSHFCGGCGAFQRRSPTGGAAYGTPKYTVVPPSTGLPFTSPVAVLTCAPATPELSATSSATHKPSLVLVTVFSSPLPG